MEILVVLIVAIIKALFPWAIEQTKSTAQEGDPDVETRDKLRKQVQKHWYCILLLFLLLTGCTRTVYVPHGTPVRLRERVKNVKVWVKDSDGKAVAGKMDLPEGWYCLPLVEEDTNGE